MSPEYFRAPIGVADTRIKDIQTLSLNTINNTMVLVDINEHDLVTIQLQLVPLLTCRVLRTRYKELNVSRTIKRVIPALYSELHGFMNEDIDDILRENATIVSHKEQEEERQYKKFLADWKLLYPYNGLPIPSWPEPGSVVVSLSPRCTRLLLKSRTLNAMLVGPIKKPLRVKQEERRHHKHYVRKSHSVDRFIERE